MPAGKPYNKNGNDSGGEKEAVLFSAELAGLFGLFGLVGLVELVELANWFGWLEYMEGAFITDEHNRK